MAEKKASFKIDGVDYPVPDDLTVKDLMWQYRYASHFGIEGEPPGICIALGAMHVAIARAKPGTPPGEIEERLLTIPVTELDGIIALAEEAAPDPEQGDELEAPPSSLSPVSVLNLGENDPSFTGGPGSVNSDSDHAISAT